MYRFFNLLKLKFFFIFLFFFYGAFIVYFSLFTYGPKSDFTILGNITVFDKFIHIFVYMLWPFFILFFFQKKIALILSICLIFSFIVEYLQIYTDRNFQILDILSNSLGIIISFFIFKFLSKYKILKFDFNENQIQKK